MGAQRKLDHDRQAPPSPATRPILAGAGAAAVDSPVHEHLARLHASFAEVEQTPPYPRALRMAIMVGAPAVLWGAVILAIGALARIAGT